MQKSKIILICSATLVLLAGCASLDAVQGSTLNPSRSAQAPIFGFEQAHTVLAQDYLPPELLESPRHRVAPNVWNDGYVNTYTIITPDFTYIVQGSERVKKRVHEIQATAQLRDMPTVATAVKALRDRTTNLVTTPLRAIQGGRARYADAQSAEDKLKNVSSGFGSVISMLGRGIAQLGVTGVRLTKGVSSTKCAGAQCVQKAGADVWSGFNSVMGKHAAAKRFHHRLGTDPYSGNKVLQREIDRLAYTESYTGTGLKTGVGMAGISVLSAVVTNVGYYNNAEFLAIYEDAHNRRNKEKALMHIWGASFADVEQLYENDTFTPTTRTQLTLALTQIEDDHFRAQFISQAAASNTRYMAESRHRIAHYLAERYREGEITGFVADTPATIAMHKSGTLILFFVADDLHWTEDIAGPISDFADIIGNSPQFSGGEIHVLGKATPLFVTNTSAMNIKIFQNR